MEFRNSTALDGERLHEIIRRHTALYRLDRLRLSVRYSRGADFSGTCFYREGRIFVNIGRHVTFPYTIATSIAKAHSNRTHWWREAYSLTVADAYQLVLFVFLHELYHYLVKLAGRSPRLKESRCDRFATRALVDEFACAVTDSRGRRVPRSRWDFQDLDRLVAKSRRNARAEPARSPPRTHQIPVHVYGLNGSPPAAGLLFDL